MKPEKISQEFGVDANNRIAHTGQPSADGAMACLETFYYCFNHKDIDTFERIWSDDGLIQADNPLGGITKGKQAIIDLYSHLFNSEANVRVKLKGITRYAAADMVVFAGTETGDFLSNRETIPLIIRTTRVFAYDRDKKSWFHIHHHGSIDDINLLQKYQRAVKK